MEKTSLHTLLAVLALGLAACSDDSTVRSKQSSATSTALSWSACTTAGIAVTLPGETVQPSLPEGFLPESFAGPSEGLVGAILNFAWSCPSGTGGGEITGSSHFLRVTPPEEWAAEHVDFYFVIYQAFANPTGLATLNKLCLPFREGMVSISGDAAQASVSIIADDQQYSFDAVSSDPQPFNFTDRVFLVEDGEVACVVEIDFETLFPTPGPGLLIADPELPFIPGPAHPGAGIVLVPDTTAISWAEVWKKGDAPLD